jgi:hypothetical protein
LVVWVNWMFLFCLWLSCMIELLYEGWKIPYCNDHYVGLSKSSVFTPFVHHYFTARLTLWSFML